MKRASLLVGLALLSATLSDPVHAQCSADSGRPESAAESTDPSHLLPVQDSDFLGDAQFRAEQVELGRLLFFDKILSGNRNISCATCHHPAHATSDGLSLPIGEGGVGLGPQRRVPDPAHAVSGRVPRNAQDLFFVGDKTRTSLFHDGRVELDPNQSYPSGFWTPAREQLPEGLQSALAAQALFPLLSPIEMAGQKGENPVATASALGKLAGPDGAWRLLVQRLRDIPEYVTRFRAAYPGVRSAADVDITHVGNAIAAFETVSFRPDGSPFDEYLRTRRRSALPGRAALGMDLFYGKAGCSECHSGKFQTDNHFHAIGMPQLGPGKGDGWNHDYFKQTGFVARLEDFGRYRVTAREQDKYAFKTPSLRNVALTGPWGHAGAFTSLESVVRHHLDPEHSLRAYHQSPAPLPDLTEIAELSANGSRLILKPINPARMAAFMQRDLWVVQSPQLLERIAEHSELTPRALSQQEVNDLVSFLRALTDPSSRDMSALVPERVPSGLPPDRPAALVLAASTQSNGATHADQRAHSQGSAPIGMCLH